MLSWFNYLPLTFSIAIFSKILKFAGIFPVHQYEIVARVS